MKNRLRQTGAFTLVEIMIVVAIIGMLATIAIPNYVKVRTEAQKTTCIQNLRTIDGAIQEWALEQKKDAGQTVTHADLRVYLRSAVACPSGGTTLEDSYTVTSVDARPSCRRKPDTHLLPL